MKLLGIENKKTKAKFLINSLTDFNYIFTGETYGNENFTDFNHVEVSKNLVVEITFKTTCTFCLSGKDFIFYCEEKDTGRPFILYNESIAKVMHGLSEKTSSYENGYYTAAFIVRKHATRYTPEFVDISALDYKEVSL